MCRMGFKALAAFGLVVLFAGAAPSEPRPAAKSRLASLQAGVMGLEAARLEEGGEAKVEAVRRRLGGLAAFAGSARSVLRGNDVAERLAAHLVLAKAYEAFARELFAVRPPPAARGVAARAWTDQVAATLERATSTARAHLRSCVDLARAANAADPGCSVVLERMGAGEGAPAGNVAAVTRARAHELQVCIDALAARRPTPATIEVSARLAVDSLGRVVSVELSPAREDRALYECLADGLWLWTFPGTADVEIDLPLRFSAVAR